MNFNILRISLLILCIFQSIVYARDFYKILGVARNAKLNQIKRAYRALVLQMHPDVNKKADADEKFKEINRAYEVLKNDELRTVYDRDGEQGLNNNMQGQGSHNPFFNFASFFNFGGSNEQPAEVRGADVTMDIFVSLEEICEGEFIEIVRNKPVKKHTSGVRKCNCRNEMKATSIGSGRFVMVQEQVCDSCPNFEFKNEEKYIEMEVEIGVEDNHQYRYRGEGEPHMDGESGDLIIMIKVERHPTFKRIGNDLYTNMTISLEDACVGFSSNIMHLDGQQILVERKGITKPGQVMIIKRRGMLDYSDNTKSGNLYITFDVEFPVKEFDEQTKNSLKQIFKQGSRTRIRND